MGEGVVCMPLRTRCQRETADCLGLLNTCNSILVWISRWQQYCPSRSEAMPLGIIATARNLRRSGNPWWLYSLVAVANDRLLVSL